MRRARFALVATGIIAIIAAVWLEFAWHSTPTSVPAASIHLITYRYFTLSNADNNVFVYPGRGSWLHADMVLTNEGRVSISYGAWGDEPYGWANVQTDQAATNGYLAPNFTGGTAVLRPGCAAKFWVVIPTNTLQWQCGFDIETASVRDRATWRALESKFYRWIPEVLFYPVRLLPDKTGPSLEVKSELLEFSETGPPHNLSPEQPAVGVGVPSSRPTPEVGGGSGLGR